MVGALGLAGWIVDAPSLVTIVPGKPPMMPNTALALVLIGLAGALRQSGSRRVRTTISMVATFVALAIGIGTSVQYVLGIDLGIDQVLFGVDQGPYPGRPSPPTAVALAALALALLLFDVRSTARIRPSELLVILAGVISFTALSGLVFGAGALYRLGPESVVGVSLPTAIGLLLVVAGLLLEHPNAGIMRVVTSRGPGGTLLRSLLPPAILAPMLLGLLIARASSMLAVGDEPSLALPVLTALLTLLALPWITVIAASLDRTHAALEASRRQTRELIELAPDGIFIADLEGRYTDVNAAGCSMLGLGREELVGKTITDLIPPEDVPRLLESKQQMRAGATHVAEWRLRRADGTLLPVEVNAKILADGRWQGFVRDISERKRLESSLRETYADLERAQSVARIGSWRLDVRRDELVWSGENYRIFGVAPDTPMTYAGFLACVHPDDRAYVDHMWTAALRGEPYDIEHRLLVGDTIKWVREKADLARDEQGVFGGLGITQDITELVAARERVRRVQERYELALRGADLGAWDWNIQTGVVIFNERWAEMRGYRPEEIEPHVSSWTSGVHPDDLPAVQRALADYFEGRSLEYENEHRARTKAGEWIWVLDRGKVFDRDDRGRPLRMVGTELDITERKRLELALRFAEARSTGILTISADAIVSIDDDQRIVQFNRGAETIFGYTREEVLGASLDILIPEGLRAIHRAHVAKFAAGKDVARRMAERQTIVGRRKNGDEFPADAAISRLDVGGVRILTAAVRDISDQKRIESEQRFLAEAGAALVATLDYEATLATIAQLAVRELADFCIVDLVDEDGEVRRLKVASRDPSRAWVCDLLVTELPRDHGRRHLIGSALATRRTVLMERFTPEQVVELSHGDSHLQTLRALDPKSMIAAPLVIRDHLVGVIAFVSTGSRVYGPADVQLIEAFAQRAALWVENARLYQAANRAIRTRDEVLGIVAHDLRNPLNTIGLQADALREHGGSLLGAADRIDRLVRRMNRLIQDLLDVSRLDAGRLGIEVDRVSAEQIVAEAARGQSPLVESAGLALDLDIDRELPDVLADRDRVLQIFENLIGNAVKFTERGGRITVGARLRDGEVLYWVADTGKGIPPAEIHHVFDRFWKARKAGIGAGLGLAIVKGLVEEHRGRIWVESVEGRGSTFYFTIPAAARALLETPALAH